MSGRTETTIGNVTVETWNEAGDGSADNWKWTAVDGQQTSAEFGTFANEAIALASAWQWLKDGNEL